MKTEFEAFRRLLEEFEMLKDLLRDEVQGLVSEFRRVRGEETEAGLAEVPRKRPKLTEADFRARAAIISDIERELQKNFQNIGSRVKKPKPKDRGDLVDKLRGL
jgi:DNA polymerase II small subunit/DNA polymerase delta subunit B